MMVDHAYFTALVVILAVSIGGWLLSVAKMSFLLLKVSGVAMLETTIKDRRPDYAGYIRRTNAFFPGPRRSTNTTEVSRS